MKNIPAALATAVAEARKAVATRATALTTLHSLDYTSLNDTDTPESIAAFLQKVDLGEDGRVTAVCVYPQFLAQCREVVAPKGIRLATVINFPSGEGELKQTADVIKTAVKNGADEIDTVLDYKSFLAGGTDKAQELLTAARSAATEGGAKLKVILESCAFTNYEDLYNASILALQAGTDFLKTSTGKHPLGGASLEAAATMLQAIKDTDSDAGLKVSGGVKTVADGAKYIALIESMMGKDWIGKGCYRVGASSVMDDIMAVLGHSQSAPSTQPSNY